MLDSTHASGFYLTGETIIEIPLNLHPIQYKKIGEDVWTQASYKINTTQTPKVTPSGLVCTNTLRENPQRAVAGSNGSVYMEGKVGSVAWMIQEDDNRCITLCFLVQDVSSLTGAVVQQSGSIPKYQQRNMEPKRHGETGDRHHVGNQPCKKGPA